MVHALISDLSRVRDSPDIDHLPPLKNISNFNVYFYFYLLRVLSDMECVCVLLANFRAELLNCFVFVRKSANSMKKRKGRHSTRTYQFCDEVIFP